MERHALEVYIEKLQGNRLLIRHNCSLDAVVRSVEHLSYDSNKTVQNTLFVCKGANFKREYLEEAVQRGAFAYISETDYETAIPCIRVSDVKKALALAAAVFYGYPAKVLTLVGITGTKGKSTTAYYVKYILDEYLMALGRPESGIISSIDTYDGVIRQESHLTTPESLELQMHFRNAADSGLGYMVMEASSQALKYGRLHGVDFDAGIFLNISEDHISPIEHSDMEDYLSAKLTMFSHCKAACINIDSDQFPRIMEAAKSAGRVLTFGTKDNADIYGYDISKEGFDTLFRVRCDRFEREFRLTMPGLFNVENALAAIAAAYTLRIPEQYIYMGLRKARSSGRMEYFANSSKDRIVIVDYAHNKLSFTKLYETVKSEFPGMKIVTVFGCPGGKAYLRRRDLGLLAGIHSDKVYLTAEDPGPEDTREISEDIAQYVRQNNPNCELIDDRELAIKESILSSKPATVILITGKGNETRQKYGREYVPVPSDVELTQKYLEILDAGHDI
ncbi:MAG: UDP-N-acetylmuramoyl-L-alanyl-D-glutamate--2,6-diaminopimelate ligase [Clostridiaceae bacterium]|jgi:UDP-N-acetylmuramoyl-L-alanyl-D-glutamate--2,6-diaminopimelate ligase|nr:UDP-N-acetylmuramoyl-L-alanyl-D-glutamate--2,6-diaminopimelate ligase [Clostridiaceae bacterium]